MAFKDKLPVSYLLFTTRGRINRSTYWTVSIFIWTTFYILFNGLEYFVSYAATLAIYPLLYFALIATATKRLHDINFSGFWLLLVLIPVLGPLALFFILGFKKGNFGSNKFGPDPNLAADYFKNGKAEKVANAEPEQFVVNDVTQLNPVIVSLVATPATIDELQTIIKNADRPISIGGGRFSMGGQTASTESLHIDMRQLNKVVEFSAENKIIKVEAGIRWCDIQHFVDEHNLSVKIMQTYANFTVGGALSVNCHGRYIGLGPVILSVRSLDIILSNGELRHVSRTEEPELFYACIGCYNAIAVIARVEFDLTDNIPVERVNKKMKRNEYRDFFVNNVRDEKDVVFHNGDIYPPHFVNVRAVSWVKTEKKPTEKTRLMPLAASYPMERYFIGAFSKSNFGKWRREHIYEPILYAKKKVHWRNYEAGYDVAELEPRSRKKSTYVLQEYFVPVKKFDEFTSVMAEIFRRHDVNVINVSIRHALPDSGSLLAWAREEVFAFVIWYKQRTDATEKNKVAVWTRELIDAAISFNGAYYLPYQAHATDQQFHDAYPSAKHLLALKDKLDPDNKFRNIVWDTYYQPKENNTMSNTDSAFKQVFSNPKWSDNFYRFLQVIFHLYPEDKFHQLIKTITFEKNTDEEIYRTVQNDLPKIKPFLSELTYALPSLKKQKREMSAQALTLLGDKKNINGYLEIGSTGRYISDLRKHTNISGPIFITNDIAPTNSIADIFERGQFTKTGQFFDLNDYQPIPSKIIADESIDLVTCYIGLHHCPHELLEGYIRSINRVLRKGGLFIMRDHDVKSAEMATFVGLVHTVFNLGLKIRWETDHQEFKSFKSIDEWSKIVCSYGFNDMGKRILQDKDPSDN
ncbi:MAG TPA: FAD-binding protein, partial [Ferruginibacter sp.]|nr:FAD-binding protein [Ferruginibacter sp.]